MERHLINTQPTHRVWNPQFNGYLDSLLGTIQYRAQAPDGSTIQRAYNKDVGALADSDTFADPGDNPLDADATGATPAQPFGGNIPLAWGFAVDDYLDFYSAELASVFTANVGSAIVFFNVSASDLIDGNTQTLLDIRSTVQDDLVLMRKSSTNNTFSCFHKSGGNTLSRDVTISQPGKYMLSQTWSKDANEYKVYLGAIQQGVTQSGLLAQSNPAATAYIGAAVGITSLWQNLISTAIIHPTRDMIVTEIADIYQRSGI